MSASVYYYHNTILSDKYFSFFPLNIAFLSTCIESPSRRIIVGNTEEIIQTKKTEGQKLTKKNDHKTSKDL